MTEFNYPVILCYMKFSEQLRRAIKKSGKSKYRIHKDTGVDIATLMRFEQGSGLSIETVDKLFKYLGLKITEPTSTKKK